MMHSDGYVPGICNIGPAEIARRRRSGHVAALVTVAGLALLLAFDVPPVWRLVLILPAAGAASGYLQAGLHFCAGFGFRGVHNFGALGPVERVIVEESIARDRRRALQIMLGSLGIGVVVAALALAL